MEREKDRLSYKRVIETSLLSFCGPSIVAAAAAEYFRSEGDFNTRDDQFCWAALWGESSLRLQQEPVTRDAVLMLTVCSLRVLRG